MFRLTLGFVRKVALIDPWREWVSRRVYEPKKYRLFLSVRRWRQVACSRRVAATLLFGQSLIVLLSSSIPAWGQPLREVDIIRLARSRSLASLEAEVENARSLARRQGAGLLANPSLHYDRQEAFDPNAQSQDMVFIRWPIELSSRPATERALAEIDRYSARRDMEHIKLEVAADFLKHFYMILAKTREVGLLTESLDELERAEQTIRTRVQQGEASEYDASRLRLEVELRRSELASSETSKAAALARLRALLQLSEPQLQGDFEVSPPPSASALCERANREHPELVVISPIVQRAQRAARSARRLGFPEVALSAGYNRQREPVGHGYTVGVELSLPFFDRHQGLREEAQVVGQRAEAVWQAMVVRIHAEIEAAHLRLTRTLAERERFSSAIDLDVLLGAVRAGYLEGERSLVELLDAQRSALQVRRRQLELDVAVRFADVALRKSAGLLR